MRGRTIALIAAAALGLGACGDDDDSPPPAEPAATTPAPATTAAPATTTDGASGTVAGISKNTSSKPKIPKPSGKPPKKLVTKDIVVGTGTAAKAGDNVVVNYVGVLHSTGEQFDASWDAGKPFAFVLGNKMVIPGWDEGVAGMKLGGRRMLTIPPDLAYGAQGQGSIGPNATLVFVVDLVNVTPA